MAWTPSLRAALSDGRRLHLGHLRRGALSLPSRQSVLRRPGRGQVPGGRVQVRASPGRHAGRRKHLPRGASSWRLGHPRVLGRQRQVGALAQHLESARLRGDPHRGGRHRPQDLGVEEQLGRPQAQQLPAERAWQPERSCHRRRDRRGDEPIRLWEHRSHLERAGVQPRERSHRRGPARGLLRGWQSRSATRAPCKGLAPDECETVACVWGAPPSTEGRRST
jgi:hypothetical protein